MQLRETWMMSFINEDAAYRVRSKGTCPASRHASLSRWAIFFVCAAYVLLFAGERNHLHAATRTWQNPISPSNLDWTTTTNWSSSTLPGTGDNTRFNGSNSDSFVVGISTTTVGPKYVLFGANGPDVGAAGAFTFTGAGTFTAPSSGIYNYSSGGNVQKFDVNVTAGSATIILAPRGGGFTFTAGHTLDLTTRGLTIQDDDATHLSSMPVQFQGPVTSSSGTITIASTNTPVTFSSSVSLGTGGINVTGIGDDISFSSNVAGSGKFSIGAGSTVTLSNTSNSFTGQLRISGTVNAASLNNTGVADSLGTQADGVVRMSNSGSGLLRYTGATDASTDRYFSLQGSDGGNSTIEVATTNSLTLSGIIGADTGTAGLTQYLTLSGSSGGNGEVTGVIEDVAQSASVIKDGTNQWTLSGANTYTGTTSIVHGALIATSNSALGAAGDNASGYTAIYAPGDGNSGNLQIGNNATVSDVLYLDTHDTNDSNTAHVYSLTGSNSTVSGVISSNLPEGTYFDDNWKYFTFQANSNSTLNLAGDVRQDIPDAAAVLTLRGAGNGTVSGNIIEPTSAYYDSTPISGNTWSLVKNGGGTWTLSGNNSYSGTTEVVSGALVINGINSGAGTVTVDIGAALGGSGSIAGAVDLSGTVSPGNSPGILTVGALTLETGSNGIFDLDNSSGAHTPGQGGLNDLISITGLLTIPSNSTIGIDLANTINQVGSWVLATYASSSIGSNETFNITGLSSVTGSISFTGNQMILTTAVPEPNSIVLAVLGVIGSCLVQRRRLSR